MREAFRVLRPGGAIALADMLPYPGRRGSRMSALGRRYGHVLAANYYDRDEYSRRLAAAGFTDINVESIREDVYPGMAKYIRQRVDHDKKIDEVVIELTDEDRAQCRGVELWERSTGVGDYVIATARKPAHNGTTV